MHVFAAFWKNIGSQKPSAAVIFTEIRRQLLCTIIHKACVAVGFHDKCRCALWFFCRVFPMFSSVNHIDAACPTFACFRCFALHKTAPSVRRHALLYFVTFLQYFERAWPLCIVQLVRVLPLLSSVNDIDAVCPNFVCFLRFALHKNAPSLRRERGRLFFW